jgi:hypothetical protein
MQIIGGGLANNLNYPILWLCKNPVTDKIGKEKTVILVAPSFMKQISIAAVSATFCQ